MKLFSVCAALAAAAGAIPDRPAAVKEALWLMGVGWGSIFIVIAILIILVLLLNAACRKKN